MALALCHMQAKEIVAKYKLKVVRIHTHIGSGSDPTVWQRVANLNMDTVKQFPDVTTLNMGGGYKVILDSPVLSVGIPI